jgi:CBS-domain-containing membrane protein
MNNTMVKPQNKAIPKKISGYFTKMKGKKRASSLSTPPNTDVFISCLGAFIGIGAVAFISIVMKLPMIVASFGASAVLIYGVPDAPLSQPRNVFFVTYCLLSPV